MTTAVRYIVSLPETTADVVSCDERCLSSEPLPGDHYVNALRHHPVLLMIIIREAISHVSKVSTDETKHFLIYIITFLVIAREPCFGAC